MDTALGSPSTSVERVEAAHRLLTIKQAAAETRLHEVIVVKSMFRLGR
jgi:hypothetical protein